MDVWLADFGLHDCFDCVGVEDSDGNVLRDDLFALAFHCEFEGFLVEEVGCGVAEGVRGIGAAVGVGSGSADDAEARVVLVCGFFGHGVDGHGEKGDAVALGEAEVGMVAADGGFEGSLERTEGELEIDCVVVFGGLEVVVIED